MERVPAKSKRTPVAKHSTESYFPAVFSVLSRVPGRQPTRKLRATNFSASETLLCTSCQLRSFWPVKTLCEAHRSCKHSVSGTGRRSDERPCFTPYTVYPALKTPDNRVSAQSAGDTGAKVGRPAGKSSALPRTVDEAGPIPGAKLQLAWRPYQHPLRVEG
jgi:hypothetical protein